MVKPPVGSASGPPAFMRGREQFLHDYAALLIIWGEFELCLEVKIAQLVGMTPKDASIVLGGLSFGNKPAILYSLLDQRGELDAVAKVRAVINHARRNMLVHGIAGSDREVPSFAFYKREVASAYKVQRLNFTTNEFNEHLERFRTLYKDAAAALGLTLDDLEDYGREAGFLAPNP